MRIKNMNGLHFYRLSSISHLQIRVRRCSAQPQVLDGIADVVAAGMDEASAVTYSIPMKTGQISRQVPIYEDLVWIQCKGYRRMAYLDATGKWINFYTGKKLTAFVKVIG